MKDTVTFPRLFVTDLDDTALLRGRKPYARFSPEFSSFLDKLDSKGCRWALNTSWDPDGQMDLVLSSGVKSRPLLLIGEFGKSISEVSGNLHTPAQPRADIIAGRIKEINERIIFGIVKDLCAGFTPLSIHYYEHFFSFKTVPAEAAALTEYFRKKYGGNQEITAFIGSGAVSVRPAFLGKGFALADALKIVSIEPDSVIAAGDDVPDIGMMNPETACFALCPRNANETVKQHVITVGGVVGAYDADAGVIDAFEKLAKQNGWNW
jgi:hydroxymethylpyrimidine pyrophosphatase-like HAD family hydrolase